MTAPPSVVALRCQGCGGELQVRAPGTTLRIICSHCGAAMDVRNEIWTRVENWHKASKAAPGNLHIGQRGTLRGIEYEVIGVVGRNEGRYRWAEYLLFNPLHGLRWLLDQEGNWSFGGALRGVDATGTPTIATGDAYYGDRRFQRFHQGSAEVFYAAGEFPWRVKVGDAARIADYIAPPGLLSLERTDKERNWTLFDYLPVQELEKAFSIQLPAPRGRVPHVPNPHYGLLKSYLIAALVLSVLLWGAHSMATADFAGETGLGVSNDVDFIYNGSSRMIGSIDLRGRSAPVQITSQAAVSNQWLELQYALVNSSTQQRFDVTQGLEYYHGIDGGESWSEGGQEKSSLFGPVPPGHYDVLLDVSSGDFSYSRFEGRVYTDISMGVRVDRVAWIVWLLIIVVPGWLLWRGYVFEKQRWSDSEFSNEG